MVFYFDNLFQQQTTDTAPVPRWDYTQPYKVQYPLVVVRECVAYQLGSEPCYERWTVLEHSADGALAHPVVVEEHHL